MKIYINKISISFILKILADILLFGIIFIIFNFVFTKGDINFDGKLSAYDIVIINRYLNGYETDTSFVDLYLMDVNYDFKITDDDITSLQIKIIKR